MKYHFITSKIFKDSSQVDRRSHANAVFRQTALDVAQHASYWEDDPSFGGPGRLCGLLLSSSARHGAEIEIVSGSAGVTSTKQITLTDFSDSVNVLKQFNYPKVESTQLANNLLNYTCVGQLYPQEYKPY